MFEFFNKLTEKTPGCLVAVKTMTGHSVPFKRLPNGDILVPGSIDISGQDLGSLPDFSNVIVQGSFLCGRNHLTTLKGAPKEVHGSFMCARNELVNLWGAPKKVGEIFDCNTNKLKNLSGAPRETGGDFVCSTNSINTLAGGPENVGGNYDCADNDLTLLTGIAPVVGKNLDCQGNHIQSFFDRPQSFGALVTDFGTYADAAALPERLQRPWKPMPDGAPQASGAAEQPYESSSDPDAGWKAETALSNPLRVGRALTLKGHG